MIKLSDNTESEESRFSDINLEGILRRLTNLSEYLIDVMNKYDWPQHIECVTPKSNRENLLKINDNLKNRVQVISSMQSMNLETLSDGCAPCASHFSALAESI